MVISNLQDHSFLQNLVLMERFDRQTF